MGTTVRDIARVARVSIGTVSRALKNQPGLSDATRRRVLLVAQQLGYDHSNLRRTRVRRLTLVGPRDYTSFSSADYTEHLRSNIERAGRGMGVTSTVLAFDPTEDLIDQLRRHAPDALAVTGLVDHAHLRKLAALNRPMVLIDQWAPGFRCVNIDNARGAELAMKHLFERGFRRVAFIGGSPAHYGVSQRALGFRRAYFEAGLPLDPALEITIPAGLDARDGAAVAMEELLALETPPDAVFGFNDVAALSALDVCVRRGLRVPEDIAVVGFDDSAAARDASLSTVVVDVAHLAETAVELLLSHDTEPLSVLEPVTFIERNTTLGETVTEGEESEDVAGN
ncbi:LacI family transcriptional regulator [Pararobbsia alpina]|uniref:LacI family DNA-binding transcriptional regulator n=1 Tax=Pararobbsia alpina TaxID=621374 RepID=UPI0039A6BABE